MWDPRRARMAFVEEVFKNNGKWYGGQTGHEYSASQIEEKGVGRWSKPSYHAPDSVVLEIEEDGQTPPSGNGCGKR